jgi:hypothetical protein
MVQQNRRSVQYFHLAYLAVCKMLYDDCTTQTRIWKKWTPIQREWVLEENNCHTVVLSGGNVDVKDKTCRQDRLTAGSSQVSSSCCEMLLQCIRDVSTFSVSSYRCLQTELCDYKISMLSYLHVKRYALDGQLHCLTSSYTTIMSEC